MQVSCDCYGFGVNFSLVYGDRIAVAAFGLFHLTRSPSSLATSFFMAAESVPEDIALRTSRISRLLHALTRNPCLTGLGSSPALILRQIVAGLMPKTALFVGRRTSASGGKSSNLIAAFFISGSLVSEAIRLFSYADRITRFYPVACLPYEAPLHNYYRLIWVAPFA